MNGHLKEWEYGSLEKIAEVFNDPKIKVISFDVFDTLVFRPLERPEDLFELLDQKFGTLSNAQISFGKLRMEAEAVLRRRILEQGREKRYKEDICLNAIYDVLEDEFGLASDIASVMKQWEWETEYRLCIPRKSGKWLFERALSVGKPVIIISDMYFNTSEITAILAKNGYSGMTSVFVSSDRGKRKITGNLYRDAAESMGVKPEEIFHIGDHVQADCEIAAQQGVRTAWLPKAIEVYDSYGCAHQVEKICGDLTDWEAAKTSVGIGIMRAMAAEMYFDDPFREFEPTSDYHADPYFVGYGALGMEVLALVRWLAEQIRRDQVKTMIFMARDGYLPMLAYNVYRQYHPELPPAGYLHISRISVLPAMLQTPEDLFDLPVDITYQTPRKLLRLLAFCTKEEWIKAFAEEEKNGRKGKDGSKEKDGRKEKDGSKVKDGRQEFRYFGEIPADVPFSRKTFQQFIAAFIRSAYDRKKHQQAIARIGEYLRKNPEAPVTEDAALFDMGYSGRIASAVIHAAKVCPKVYYFHTDSREHFRYEKRSGMKIRAFFDFKPYMESSLREYSYLEPSASCIAYTQDLQPVYDAGPAEGYQDTVEAMQKGAMDFVRDFMGYFAAFEQEASCRHHEAAMPFEAFLRYCSPYDRRMYEHILIDDELWGGRRDIHLRELMEIRLRKIPDYAKEKIHKSPV